MPDGFYIFMNTAQIKEGVLNGVALDDDKREQFNKIEQVLLYQQFSFERQSCLLFLPGTLGYVHMLPSALLSSMTTTVQCMS